jgi:taurine dioxygenase
MQIPSTSAAYANVQMRKTIEVHPVIPAVGAEIRNVNIADLTDEQFQLIYAAWLSYSALVVRGQDLSDAALIAFSKRFGELDPPPVNENGKKFVEGYPEIYVVSNVKGADGLPIGSLGSGEAVWHTDMSYLSEPPDASMLYSLEVPATGGNTWICGMNAAFKALPKNLLDKVKHLCIKHDGTYNSGGYLRSGLKESSDPTTSVGTPHPIICEHPLTGVPTLYLGRRRNAYIMGLKIAESEALLDALWAHAAQPQFSFVHEWRVGDLLMWDNRCTMHRRDPFDDASRRIMHRTQIKGQSVPQRAVV